MHASAYHTARQFLSVYATNLSAGTVIEIGSRLVAEQQRTLRQLCPTHLTYVGFDLEIGVNVDVVLVDPYKFPLPDSSVDIVLCTSVFEHCNFFWKLFEECLRVLRTGGLLYLNAPSNGYVHRYPVDCWRFYPDSGVALEEYGQTLGFDVALLESFVTDENLSENREEIWNDFVAVFIKGSSEATRYPNRMYELRDDYSNARLPKHTELIRANRFPGRSQEEALRWSHEGTSKSQNVRLYQIAYSEDTWRSVPKSLLPLDNRANERPDWAEYWPVRKFFKTEQLDENCFYGFLSPRFSEKTFFPPEALIDFVASVTDDVDVAAFSPFFDLRAAFRNVFEQGEWAHPGFMDISKLVIGEILPGVELSELVNTSFNGIYCNYFAAKPRFWRRWLALCEHIFDIAETPAHHSYRALNEEYFYGTDRMPAKVFIIERIASLILAASDEFKTQKFGKSTLTTIWGELPYALFSNLDQLKIQAIQGHSMLMNSFSHIQNDILHSAGVEREYEKNLAKNSSFGVSHLPSRGYEHWGSQTPARRIVPE